MSTKFSKDDIIMGYQIAVNYTGLFAGKILRVRPAIKLFGNPSYEIELMEVFQTKGHTKIWVDEDFSLPFDKEKFEIAIFHWNQFHEHINKSKEEIRELRALFSKS
ncbi:MAG: hypothetical protein PHH85_08960 [Candidatus Methanoperedens sp.]|nr:hypothetical protein [Candidatus Methanoperedens sp.]